MCTNNKLKSAQLKSLFESFMSSYWQENFKLSYSSSSLIEPMEYSLFSGGKRVRPLFVLSIPSDISQNVLKSALALEMIHTYSLIHDDLPLMDDDDLRRGVPTCHKVYGPGIALLAGSLLYTEAISILLSVDPLIADFVLKKTGFLGLMEGQALDINTPDLVDLNYILQVHELKTGALIESSFFVGAYLSGYRGDKLNCYQSAGKALGVGFQIIDDILDYKNKKNEKINITNVLSLDQAYVMASNYTDKALNLLSDLNNSLLIDMAKELLERKI